MLRHRDSKTKKPRHRDSKTKKPHGCLRGDISLSVRNLTLVEAGNFKMVRDILRTFQRLRKLGKLGSYAILCFNYHKKGQERVPKDLASIENVTFNANQNACGLGVLFNIPGRSCG